MATQADPENSIRGGGADFIFLFLEPSTYFTEDRTKLPRVASGPKGPNRF